MQGDSTQVMHAQAVLLRGVRRFRRQQQSTAGRPAGESGAMFTPAAMKSVPV